MDKIAILRGHSEGNDILIKCLRLLFPEAEIEILSGEMENVEDSLFPQRMEERHYGES